MGAMFNKPANLKYTDLAIYIDANAHKIINEGEFPLVEATIYEYLYHIVYALACKAAYFKPQYYDSFAGYAAGELYMSMRKKLINDGKDNRGRTVVPVKSSLNFIKATLFPLKINYQKENFGSVIDPNVHGGTDLLKENITEAIQQQYRTIPIEVYQDTAQELPQIIKQVIQKTPFRNDCLFCQKLYISIILTLLNDITLPSKIHKKISKNLAKRVTNKTPLQLLSLYTNNIEAPILWHLDKSFQDYVRIMVIKVKQLIAKSVEIGMHSGELSDELIDRLMRGAYDTYDEKGDVD